jgi:hypothetical protein
LQAATTSELIDPEMSASISAMVAGRILVLFVEFKLSL